MYDLFIIIISRLKLILTFIDEKKSVKRKKEIKESSALKKMKQLYPPRALMGIHKTCYELVFLSCKTTTTFGLVTVSDMI